MKRVLAHDQIIFATPIYWYAVSPAMKVFLDRLSALPGGRLEVVPEDELGLPDLAQSFAALPPGAAAYCCGPAGMLTAGLPFMLEGAVRAPLFMRAAVRPSS